jgi:putative heme-binding domain-containing protein
MVSSVDATERIHAMRLLGRAEHRNLVELLVAGLNDANPLVRRAAAESAMTTGAPGMVRALLSARDSAAPDDDHLRHTLLIALRNRLAASEEVTPNESVNTHRNVLVAAYLGVTGAKAASFLSSELDKAAPALRPEMVRHVARHGDDASFKALVVSLGRDGLSLVERAQLLVEMEKGATQAGRKPPESIQKLAESQAALLMGQSGTRMAGIELAGAYRSKAEELAAFVADPTNSEPLRMAALRALGADAAKGWTGVLAKVLADSGAPVALRQECGTGLVRSDKPLVRKAAGDAITALPSGLQDALAREMATRGDSGAELLDLVSKGKVSARVLRDRVVSMRIDGLKNPAIAKRVTDLTAGIPLADAAIAQRIAAVRAAAVGKRGDIKHGKELFTKHCAACHQVAGMGARVGPQLDGVALRGVERLAEDVLDPSRNVDQAFRTTVIALKNGRTLSGLLLREEGKTIILADVMGKDVVVLADDIEGRSLSPLSPMPAGMGDRVSPTDLVDLFSYFATPGG